MRSTHYANGDSINNLQTNEDWSGAQESNIPGWCVFENDLTLLESQGGLIYNWYAVNDPRNVCPIGFHVASDEDWRILELHAGVPADELYNNGWRGNAENAGEALKSSEGWNPPTEGPFNSTGFSAHQQNARSYGGNFYPFESNWGSFWTSSEIDDLHAYSRALSFHPLGFYYTTGIQRWGSYYHAWKWYGHAVRCIKD